MPPKNLLQPAICSERKKLTWQVKGLADVWDLRGLGETAVPPEPPAWNDIDWFQVVRAKMQALNEKSSPVSRDPHLHWELVTPPAIVSPAAAAHLCWPRELRCLLASRCQSEDASQSSWMGLLHPQSSVSGACLAPLPLLMWLTCPENNQGCLLPVAEAVDRLPAQLPTNPVLTTFSPKKLSGSLFSQKILVLITYYLGHRVRSCR